MKYKKSINCKKPKGFSQKQYCKFGRKKKGGGVIWTSYGPDELINIINNETTTLVQLKSIIDQLNTFDTEGNLTKTTKPGYMALIRYTRLYPSQDSKYNNFKTRALNLIEESRRGTPIVGVDYNIEEFYGQFEPTSQNDQEDNELGPPPPPQPLVRQRANFI